MGYTAKEIVMASERPQSEGEMAVQGDKSAYVVRRRLHGLLRGDVRGHFDRGGIGLDRDGIGFQVERLGLDVYMLSVVRHMR